MTIYDDNKHPRGQADNPGQFRDKANSGPEASLPFVAPRPAAPGHVVLERWNDNDYSEVVGQTDDFDFGAVLDSYSLDTVRGLRDEGMTNADRIFEDAVVLGLAEEHDGPFTVTVDDDVIDAYIASRDSNLQQDPISSIPTSVEIKATT